MDHGLLAELFRSARAYHSALAAYAAALRSGEDIESAAQTVVGTGLHYRMALERLHRENEPESMRMVASRGRLERLRALLASATRCYNLVK